MDGPGMPPVYARGEDARAPARALDDVDAAVDRRARCASARAGLGARATEDASMATRGARFAQCGARVG